VNAGNVMNEVLVTDLDRYERLNALVENKEAFYLVVPGDHRHIALYRNAVAQVLSTGYPPNRLKHLFEFMKTSDIYTFWSIAVHANSYSGKLLSNENSIRLLFEPPKSNEVM